MGFAAEFFERVGEARRPTLELAQRLDFKTLAKPWLVMLYQVIRASSPVLRHARRRCTPAYEDRFGTELLEFLYRKVDEEEGHDEMLLADIEGVGVDANASPLNPFIAEMVGRQYYLIDFVHPSAYLGFIGLLEGFPPTLEQVDALQRASGLPPEAFRTARLHAAVDVKHRQDLAGMLDSAPESFRQAILDNALRCAELQRLALETLAKESLQ